VRNWLFGLLTLLISPSGVRAVPPDQVIVMSPDSDRFAKGLPGKWQAFSMNPEVVVPQAFDTAEVHMVAKKSGATIVLLVNRAIGQVIVWNVRVSTETNPRPKPQTASLQGPCNCGHGGDYPLKCTVASKACFTALRAFLVDSDLTASDLRLTYTVEGLQALLLEMDGRLKSAGFDGVSVAFSGVNLRLAGTLPDRTSWRKLIATAYAGMVGRMLLDDRLQVGEKSP
jgi:hypothetical protein